MQVRQLNLFTEPGLFFRQLKENPTIILPIVFILLYTFISIPNGDFYQNVMENYFNVDIPDGESTQLINMVILVITNLIYWVIRTGVYSLFIRLAGGSKVKAKVIFSMTGYFILPSLFAMLLTTLVLLPTGQMIPLGLEAFLPLEERLFTLHGMILASITPFAVAYIAMASAAIKNVSNLSLKKSLVITIIFWILSTSWQISYNYLLLQRLTK